ncbi:lytic murein transglycosylase [Rhizomicrobium electricum]|uniref:Lytic murein transglycosylase n=1 Tax=Rhizomicrobium electricum TaxID=480070 RepID=A0ABN1EYY5_9PROT|nr:membrane-bound lytic murein transglycosylase B [Rhizomicrobium electricum]
MRGIVLFLAWLFSLMLVAAAYGADSSVPVPSPSPLAAMEAEDAAFTAFLTDFRSQALAAGITPETYDNATRIIRRNQRISDHNLNQPEFVTPIWQYLDNAVSAERITNGRALLVGDADILAAVTARFHVPPEILVAIWGNESDYGRGSMGRYNMFEALATLAYDGPRMDYARPQLLAALKMMQREGYAPETMTSSWAGAFGQTQFVPTTFLAQAVDGDGDGRIDLWNSPGDALASTANVIRSAGWVDGKPWGTEVALPAGFAYENADLDIVKPVAAWKKLGVKTIQGGELEAADQPASLYLPAGAYGPAFLVFPNFKVILRYNNAASYALAVCLLADQLKGAPAVIATWPRGLAPLNRDERLALQTSLSTLGFDIGKADGMIGAKSRAAVRGWQKAHNLPADGYPTQDLLTRIASEAHSPVANR